ncbi:MAG: acetylornithine transaminase [Vulcanibacillus sp.]
MSSLFPNYPKGMIRPVRGEGSWIFDEYDNKYLDFTSGIGVCQLGHVHETVKNDVIKQLNTLWHTSNLFTITPQEELANKLTELSGLDNVFFANSGAEANEAAIKLARRYQQKVKNNSRFQIITFNQSFHGRTLATLTATGQEKVKEGFSPLPEGFITVPYGDIKALKEAITDQTAAIMLEAIQGEGGINPADSAWLIEVERLASEKDILLIIDEVQTGIGRTGKWFGFQHYPIMPDVITLAKGLGNGIPIGAMLANSKVREAFALGSHGSTFGGNFISTTAALSTIKVIELEKILQNVVAMETYLFSKLNEILSVYPNLKEIRGKGLMIGIEWDKPVAQLVQLCKDEGLLVLVAGPNVLRLLPPLNITKDELDYGIDRFKYCVDRWTEK